jgi:hypothetical protein
VLRRWCVAGERGRDDDRRSPGGGELRLIFRVGDEGELARAGAVDGGDAADLDAAVALVLETTAEPLGNFFQLDRDGWVTGAS